MGTVSTTETELQVWKAKIDSFVHVKQIVVIDWFPVAVFRWIQTLFVEDVEKGKISIKILRNSQ